MQTIFLELGQMPAPMPAPNFTGQSDHHEFAVCQLIDLLGQAIGDAFSLTDAASK